MKKVLTILSGALLFGAIAAYAFLQTSGGSLIYKMPIAPLNANQQNLAQELGYPADTKLLVINSDDTGAHPTFLTGVFDTMEFGLVKSTSVIVHDRNDEDLARIAQVASESPQWGIGIHLTLTNEYQENHPWSPVLPKEQVPSLYNDQGLMWEKISEVETNVDPNHAALEFEAQIKKALELGIQLTHIDSHMGTIYRNSRYPGAERDGLRMAAIGVAEKYNLPMTTNTFDEDSEATMVYMDEHRMIRPDTLFGFYELEEINSHLGYEGSAAQRWITAVVVKSVFGFELPYKNHPSVEEDVPVRLEILKHALANIVKPGLNHFYMHAASEEEGKKSVIPRGMNHDEGVDALVRLSDASVWSSEEIRAFLESQKIELINYTELQRIQQARTR